MLINTEYRESVSKEATSFHGMNILHRVFNTIKYVEYTGY